jgi:acyl carrier protein
MKGCNVSTEIEIKSFIIANFARDVTLDQLSSDLDVLDSGIVDSLGLLRLIAWVGDNYNIPINDVDLSPDDFRSVDTILAFVETCQSEGIRYDRSH